jgi:hypothetical protein
MLKSEYVVRIQNLCQDIRAPGQKPLPGKVDKEVPARQYLSSDHQAYQLQVNKGIDLHLSFNAVSGAPVFCDGGPRFFTGCFHFGVDVCPTP